jgi:hypothetical protein
MDKITVDVIAGPIDQADLAGLVESEIGLWAHDARRNSPTVRADWPQTDGAQYFRDVAGSPRSLLLAARADGAVIGHLVGRFGRAQ